MLPYVAWGLCMCTEAGKHPNHIRNEDALKVPAPLTEVESPLESVGISSRSALLIGTRTTAWEKPDKHTQLSLNRIKTLEQIDLKNTNVCSVYEVCCSGLIAWTLFDVPFSRPAHLTRYFICALWSWYQRGFNIFKGCGLSVNTICIKIDVFDVLLI